MPEVKLADDATKEDIDKAVDQIMADKAGEPDQSDSERVASDSDKPVTQRDTDPPKDEIGGSDSGEEEEAAEESDSDWLTKDLRAEATALGIDEEELAEFTSREELERSLRILDRSMAEDRKAVAEERKKESEKPSKEPTEDSAKETSSEGKYEVGLDKDVFEDALVDEFARLSDYYESRLSALEQRLGDADTAAAEERFDRSVDDLGFASFFGTTGKESDTEMDRRKELFEHVQIEQEVLERRGRRIGDYNALVERVARALFPDEYEKKTIKNHTRKLSRQSDRRQGGSATRATEPGTSWLDEVQQHYRELENAGG